MSETIRKQIVQPRTPYLYLNPLLGKPFNIVLSGFIPSDASTFTAINLATHSDRFPMICLPFHMSIRPLERELVRNSYVAGKGWQSPEERQLMSNDGFPIPLGSRFDMIIACNEQEISVTINGSLAFKFQHRVDPTNINLFEIHGSIFIESICFDFL
ncbi:Lectin, galactoside-binding, soluble [Blomia tropicalis]|nr:Lectin, galactoside-binding, soluble [Blomia tropicalis]